MHKSIYDHVMWFLCQRNKQRKDSSFKWVQWLFLIIFAVDLCCFNRLLSYVWGNHLYKEAWCLLRSGALKNNTLLLSPFKLESTLLSSLKSLLIVMIHSSDVKIAQSSRASIWQGSIQTSYKAKSTKAKALNEQKSQLWK